MLVTGSPAARPGSRSVVWDSGAVASAQQAFVPYSGPRLDGDHEYWWTVATRGARGRFDPFAPSSSFVTVPRPDQWQASWVAPGGSSPARERYTYVRTVADVGAGPIVRATAYVAASHQYQLWINGRRAAAGPSFSYPDEQYVQATDVTSLLRPGAPNGIGVLHHWYGAGQGRPASTPGLLAEISVVHRDGTREVVGSDGSWREQPAEWAPGAPRNDEGDFTEVVDGRAHPAGWSTARFDDSSWRPVAVLGPPGVTPFTDLIAQRTRIATRAVTPVSVRQLPSGQVVADYGAVYAATPVVRFGHGSPGRPIDVRAGFALDADGRVSATHLNQGTDMSYHYTERGGRETFEPFGYLAFRYLEVDDPGEALRADQLTVEARHSVMPDDRAARFASSDPALDAVWRLTRRSALYVSQEQFVDTPTREKGQFLLDSYDDSLATTRAFGEQNLTWQALRDFARSQERYWPDGRLNVVYPNGDGTPRHPRQHRALSRLGLGVLPRHRGPVDAGDPRPVVATRVASYLAAATDPATGLVTRLPGGGSDYLYGAVDWPPSMRYGYDMGTAARTTVNTLAVNAYAAVARMADVLGDPTAAGTWRARRDALVDAMNARVRRPDGVYVDGLEPDGSMSAHASQQANAFALAYGVVPASQRSSVGAYVASLGIALGPDNGIVLLAALHAAGHDAEVRRVLTDAIAPGLGPHPRRRRVVHLGDLGPGGRGLRQHVTRLGIGRPGSLPRDVPGHRRRRAPRHAGGRAPRPGRTIERAVTRRGHGADRERPGLGRVAPRPRRCRSPTAASHPTPRLRSGSELTAPGRSPSPAAPCTTARACGSVPPGRTPSTSRSAQGATRSTPREPADP